MNYGSININKLANNLNGQPKGSFMAQPQDGILYAILKVFEEFVLT